MPRTSAVAAIVAGLAGAAARVFERRGEVDDARRHPPRGTRVRVDGADVHITRLGQGGPAVIFDAGIAASSLSWSRVQPRVAEHAETCAYDRPGLAWSELRPGPFTASRLASVLHTTLTTAGVSPPYLLVGHSFGTFVVRCFADRWPDLVAGLVLVDPIYPASWIALDRAGQRRLAGGVWLSRVGAVLAWFGIVRMCLRLLARGQTAVPKTVSTLFGSEASALMHRLAGEVQKLPPELWPDVQAHWSQPKAFRSMARHLRDLPASAAEAARLERPTTTPIVVLTAASQPEECVREHARIAAASSCGRHVRATAAGHWIHLDDPDLVVDAIVAMLNDIRRRNDAPR